MGAYPHSCPKPGTRFCSKTRHGLESKHDTPPRTVSMSDSTILLFSSVNVKLWPYFLMDGLSLQESLTLGLLFNASLRRGAIDLAIPNS